METTLETPAPTITPESSAPAAAPAIAPAAPSGTPAAAPSPPGRPSSFRDALAKQEAINPTAPVVPGEDKAPAAIVPPETTAAPETEKPAPLAPPEKAWPQILANARTKATADAQAQFDREYGWAKAIPRESLEEMHRISKRLIEDPVGFYHELGGQLQRHPVHAQALRSEAGRALSGHANGEPQPDVQLVNEQGQVTGMTYSAEMTAKRDAWLRDQWRADLQREVGPWKAQEQARQAEALQAKTQAELNTKADAILAEVDEILDGRQDLWPEVDALMASSPGLSVHAAALHVRKQRIVPQSQAQASAQAAQTFRQKAAATTADGRASTSSPPKRPQTRQELAALLRAGEERG